MITNLKIRNFRGIGRVSLAGLARINLISGRNGVGKTSVLEAIYLISAPQAHDPITAINDVRGITPPSVDDLFADAFTNFDNGLTISIGAEYGLGHQTGELHIFLRERTERSVARRNATGQSASILGSSDRSASQFEVVFERRHPDGLVTESTVWLSSRVPIGRQSGESEERIEVYAPYNNQLRADPVYYLSPAGLRSQAIWSTLFGQLQRDGSDTDILDLLRTIEPRIQSVVPITSRNGVVVHAKIAGMRQAMPLALVGEGLNRVFQLGVLTRSAQGGTLLIDEIENGLHFRSLPEMFSNLFELATRFDVQVFAVTHSDECVDAARQAMGQTKMPSLSYYRLGREKAGVQAHHFDIDKLDRAHEFGMEVR